MSQTLCDIKKIKIRPSNFFLGTQIGFYSSPSGPLLKWIGNKHKHAKHILKYFPDSYNTYIEPFLGSGAILGHVAPNKGIAADILSPLIDFWNQVKCHPKRVVQYYTDNITYKDKKTHYESIKDRFNNNPNGLDLLMLSRLCYGGVIRFTKVGNMSTPVGPHTPIPAEKFESRLWDRHERIKNTEFYNKDFEDIVGMAQKGDLIYCDPPYVDSQSIIYGAQGFSLKRLLDALLKAKKRGAYIMLSIDGKKRSGTHNVEIESINGLFAREIFVDCGFSMLNRLQRDGGNMEGEQVHDRLLLSR